MAIFTSSDLAHKKYTQVKRVKWSINRTKYLYTSLDKIGEGPHKSQWIRLNGASTSVVLETKGNLANLLRTLVWQCLQTLFLTVNLSERSWELNIDSNRLTCGWLKRRCQRSQLFSLCEVEDEEVIVRQKGGLFFGFRSRWNKRPCICPSWSLALFEGPVHHNHEKKIYLKNCDQ